MAISVKVVRVPGAVVELVLEGGATVGQALAAANITPTSGESVKVNAADATSDTALSDGDRVYISKAAKGA